jgi:alanyl-tRNA synthetase
MGEQRARSRAASRFAGEADAQVWADHSLPPSEFLGYTELAAAGRVLALVAGDDEVSRAEAGQAVQVVLDRTPFYAESGGQVGDAGWLTSETGRVRINDTQRPVPGLIVHYGEVEQGSVARGETLTAQVDVTRRGDIQRNHTATHLLHRALRDVLGEHAAQAGSLVAPERLRFDFTHTRTIAPEQLREIEERINSWVRADGSVTWDVTDYQSAIQQGAMALFGEKYGDQVRVVHIARDGAAPDAVNAFASRDSLELCGGTHVARTGEIGTARIVAESSVGSGLRRIEMLTGRGADVWVDEQLGTLNRLAAQLGVPVAQLDQRIEALLAEQKQRQQELDALRRQQMRGALEGLLERTQQVDGVTLLATRVEVSEVTHLREMGDWLRDKLGSVVLVLGAVANEKPHLLAMITPDLVKQGYHAGNLVRALAQIVGGGGGGRPDMAQAGGRDPDKLGEALAQVPRLLAEQGNKAQH